MISDLSSLQSLSSLRAEIDGRRPVLGTDAYRGLAGDVVELLAPQTEADPAALLFNFLACFGALVGSGPHARADGARHPARLFTVVVGDTAQARKGTAYAQVREIFRLAAPDFVRTRVLSGFGSGEALIDSIARVHSAEGDELGVIVREGEYARLLKTAGREGSTLSPIIRDAWDGEALAVRSRAGTSVVENADLVVMGDITAEELRRVLVGTEVANGWANRFLFVFARRSKLLPEGGAVGDARLLALAERVRGTADEVRRFGEMTRTTKAKRVWADLYAELAEDCPGGLLESVTARSHAQALRLSVAFALADGSSQIDAAHVAAARSAWLYCRASAAWVFGEALGDPDADRILDAIRLAGPDGLDSTQLHGLFGRHRSSAVAEVRRALIERGLVQLETVHTGGRPRKVLRLATEAT